MTAALLVATTAGPFGGVILTALLVAVGVGGLPRLILARDLAKLLGLKSAASLAKARQRGSGPPGAIRLSRTSVAYRLDGPDGVEAWLAERQAATEAGGPVEAPNAKADT